ncbi:MAG: outer membrane lipoprotein-sorting protein [Deltaproteobacteria bacterium]
MKMNNLSGVKRISLFLILCSFLVPACPGHTAETLNAKRILDKVDDLFRGNSSKGVMTMKIVTVHWTRTLKVEWWSEGKDKSLMRILSPKKEKGTATLRVANDIWNYLPKVNRIIKLPSSMMSASWMGSHFTNDDLVKESRMADDYTFELTSEGAGKTPHVLEVTCYPKPDAAVVWGKILVVVRAVDYLPVKILYYDEDMKLVRIMYFSQIGPLGNRVLPKVMRIVPEDKPNEMTEITYEAMTFDLPLPARTFSLRSLRR